MSRSYLILFTFSMNITRIHFAWNTKGGKYHCTVDYLFDWFGISCITTANFCFYLQNRLILMSKTGGQQYSDTSPFSIPCILACCSSTEVEHLTHHLKVEGSSPPESKNIVEWSVNILGLWYCVWIIEIGLELAPFVFFNLFFSRIWTCKKPADYGPQQHQKLIIKVWFSHN